MCIVQAGISMRDVVVEPQEMLALYSSEAQLERGHTVMLSRSVQYSTVQYSTVHRDAEQPPVPEPEHLHHRGDHVSPAQGAAAPGHPGARGAGEAYTVRLE